MRKERGLPRASWAITRYCLLAALALVALVNLAHVWPGRTYGGDGMQATSTVKSTDHSSWRPSTRYQTRKQLIVEGISWKSSSPLVVHLNCADQLPGCKQQRHNGNCSTHILKGFHTCMASCGICPALELALRTSLNLSESQLVVSTAPGPPACRDDVTDCDKLTAASEGGGGGSRGCGGSSIEVVGSCKATCGACLPFPAPSSGPSDPSCFDAADMCSWWARRHPRVCAAAAANLHSWWWVAVACRRSCGLCGELSTASTTLTTGSTGSITASGAARGGVGDSVGGGEGGAGGGGTGGVVEAAGGGGALATDGEMVAEAEALKAAAAHGVQVGEAPDGPPAVAVYEQLPAEAGDCKDTDATRCTHWAAAGECSRNWAFLGGACARWCGACPLWLHLPYPLAMVRLNNGALMPTVGYGCAGLGDAAGETVRWALEAGYRHLDSAQAREWYREDLVGEALDAFLMAEALAAAEGQGLGDTVRRQDVWLTSKLHPRHLGYETTLRQFNASLKDLRTPYLDLFLLHYPECWGDLCGGVIPSGTFLDSWRALEELYAAGVVRAIGVSNFSPDQLARLLSTARVCPAVLQTHVDPLARNEEVQTQCRQTGVTLTAYSTLGTQWPASRGGGEGRGGGNPVLGNPVLQRIGQQIAPSGVGGGGGGGGGIGGGGSGGNRSAAQVALRWALQSGMVVLPRSSNRGRMAANLELFGWGLSGAQMGEVGRLGLPGSK